MWADGRMTNGTRWEADSITTLRRSSLTTLTPRRSLRHCLLPVGDSSMRERRRHFISQLGMAISGSRWVKVWASR